MLNLDECHVNILPADDKETMRLIRHGNLVHKFIIKNGTTLLR